MVFPLGVESQSCLFLTGKSDYLTLKRCENSRMKNQITSMLKASNEIICNPIFSSRNVRYTTDGASEAE